MRSRNSARVVNNLIASDESTRERNIPWFSKQRLAQHCFQRLQPRVAALLRLRSPRLPTAADPRSARLPARARRGSATARNPPSRPARLRVRQYDRCSVCCARVSPTYISRRSSSTLPASIASRCGSTPSSSPTRNTCGNSSPFAACSVDSRTASAGLALASFEHRDQRDHLRELEQVLPVGLALAREPADEIVDALRARLRVTPIERRHEPFRIADPAHQLVEQPPRRLALGAMAQAVDHARRTRRAPRAAAPAPPLRATARTRRRTGSTAVACATSPRWRERRRHRRRAAARPARERTLDRRPRSRSGADRQRCP